MPVTLQILNVKKDIVQPKNVLNTRFMKRAQNVCTYHAILIALKGMNADMLILVKIVCLDQFASL